MLLPFFMGYALAVGTLIALLCGPMGSLMLWQRMIYFGEALSHAGLLGVGLAVLISGVPYGLMTGLVCLLLGVLLRLLERQSAIGSDALVGVLSHAVLAVGLIVMSSLSTARVNVQGLLFGDILAIEPRMVWVSLSVALGIACLLKRYWAALISAIVYAPLAQIEGVPVERLRTYYVLLLSLVIALSIKIIGVLLITALLVIPAASARLVSRSPERMALIASAIGVFSVWVGFGCAYLQDWPPGPSIVVVASGVFVSLYVLNKNDNNS